MRENAALITSVNKDKETNASFYDQRSGMTHKQKTTTLFNKCTRFQQENDNCEGKIGRPTYIQKTVTLLHRKRYLLKIFSSSQVRDKNNLFLLGKWRNSIVYICTLFENHLPKKFESIQIFAPFVFVVFICQSSSIQQLTFTKIRPIL